MRAACTADVFVVVDSASAKSVPLKLETQGAASPLRILEGVPAGAQTIAQHLTRLDEDLQGGVMWLYGPSSFNHRWLLKEVVSEMVRALARQGTRVALVAQRFDAAARSVGGVFIDLLSLKEVPLQLTGVGDDVVSAMSLTARHAIPEEAFAPCASPQCVERRLRCALEWWDAQGVPSHTYVVFSTLNSTVCCVRLEGFSADTTGASACAEASMVNTSLSQLERLFVQQLDAGSRYPKGRHLPFFTSPTTKVAQCVMQPYAATCFALGLHGSAEAAEADAYTVRFARRLLSVDLQLLPKVVAAASLEHSRAADRSGHLAAVAIQRWWRCLMQRWALSAEEARRRRGIAAYERSAAEALFSMSRCGGATSQPRQPTKPRAPRSHVRRASVPHIDASSQTAENSRCEVGVGVSAASWPRRSIGVTIKLSCDASQGDYAAIVAERDVLRCEVERLRALAYGDDTTKWKYILEKNSTQRLRIEELERELRHQRREEAAAAPYRGGVGV